MLDFGIFVSGLGVVTMLYGTIENIILIVGLEVEDHPLIYQDILQDEQEKVVSEEQKEVVSEEELDYSPDQ